MTQYSNGWFEEFQMWTGAGYAVVYTNPHGSSGHTEAFVRALRSPKRRRCPAPDGVGSTPTTSSPCSTPRSPATPHSTRTASVYSAAPTAAT
jgi:hypothetical protein